MYFNDGFYGTFYTCALAVAIILYFWTSLHIVSPPQPPPPLIVRFHFVCVYSLVFLLSLEMYVVFLIRRIQLLACRMWEMDPCGVAWIGLVGNAGDVQIVREHRGRKCHINRRQWCQVQ